MTKNNKQIGTEFENDICAYFFKEKRMWAGKQNPAPNGSQSFDIIVIGKDETLAIDCKTLEKGRFPLSRVEDNQYTAFHLLHSIGFYNTYFVIKIDDRDVIFAKASYILTKIDEGAKSIPVEELISRFGIVHIK